MWPDFHHLGGNVCVCVFATFSNLSTVTMETACVRARARAFNLSELSHDPADLLY